MKSGRRRAREYALQGLYQWCLAGSELAAIEAELKAHKDFARADAEHFERLLQGIMAEPRALEEALQPFLDRPVTELSPIEHCILLIGAFELMRHPEIPYRVVINEAVELAKTFGGTDGHRYVNGVLDKLAGKLRPLEVAEKRGG